MEYDPQFPPAPPESREPPSEPPSALPGTAGLLGEAPPEPCLVSAPGPPYDRYPFWGYADIVVFFLLAFGVVLVGRLLQTPDVNTPMKQLLSDRSSVLLIAIFAVTLGPLCEELAFRGFLQPLLVRSFGPVPGVILGAVPFGLLHLS